MSPRFISERYAVYSGGVGWLNVAANTFSKINTTGCGDSTLGYLFP